MHQSLARQLKPAARFGTHAPPLQKAVATQSVSVAQLVLQAVAPQVKVPHDDMTPGSQVPRPSQVPADVSKPPVHDGGVQVVLAG